MKKVISEKSVILFSDDIIFPCSNIGIEYICDQPDLYFKRREYLCSTTVDRKLGLVGGGDFWEIQSEKKRYTSCVYLPYVH